MRRLLPLVLLLASCSSPTAPTDDPSELHILAETQRFAAMLRVSVTAEVTDEVYMVPANAPAYPGEKVPAAGWYKKGHIKYWRTVVRERGESFGTALAAHEVSHVLFHEEAGASGCASFLLRGQPCR